MGNLFSTCFRKQTDVPLKQPAKSTLEPSTEKVVTVEENKGSKSDIQFLNDINVDVIETGLRSSPSQEDNRTATITDVEENVDESQKNQNINTAITTAVDSVIEEIENVDSVEVCQKDTGNKNIANESGPSDITKSEANAETVDIDVTIPAEDTQPETKTPTVPEVIRDVKVKKVRPKAAKGPRAMPRSSVSMENGVLNWSRYMESVSINLEDRSPLLDRRFRPKAAKGARTPMSITAVGSVNKHAFSYGDRDMKIRRPQLTVQAEKTEEDKALENWSQRVLQEGGKEE